MSKHRVVIVGTGQSVNNHLQALKELHERVELVAAVDIDAARVAAFCAEQGIPNHYTSVGAMLAAEQPNLVCVVTPPATHKDISLECLEAGAWVYCEKPLCGSLADFDAIRDAQARTGRYVSTVFQWRFGSAVKHLQQLMASGALGKPLVAVCNTLWYRTQDYYNVAWRGKYDTEFGGPTMTLGIHLMDLCLHLLGGWHEVQAMIGTLDRQIQVEDVSMALVRFQNGAMATLINSALSPRQETHLRLDFQKATVEVNALYRYSNEHWKFSLPPNTEDDALQSLWNSLDQDFMGAHVQQLHEILDALERNQPPPVSGDDARHIIEFTASLYKSAWLGRPVLYGEITPNDPFYYSNNGVSLP